MFTSMLSAPGSGCAELEGMQKWVILTQLDLRKLMSERALCKYSGLHGAQPLLLTLLGVNLRRHVCQLILSTWVPQEGQNQGFKCKSFIYGRVPGNTTRRVGKVRQKPVHKGGVIKPVTTVVKGA